MQLSESIRSDILAAQDPWPANKLQRAVARPQVNQVIGGLYLGNDEKFVEITSLECRSAKNIPLNTSNPHLFECVVSVCTYARMVKEMPDLKNHSLASVEAILKARNIEWIQMGRSIPDDTQAWTDLVYNATFENSALAQEDVIIPNESQDPAHIALRAAKREVVSALPVEKWFESAFKIFDAAVFTSDDNFDLSIMRRMSPKDL